MIDGAERAKREAFLDQYDQLCAAFELMLVSYEDLWVQPFRRDHAPSGDISISSDPKDEDDA